MWEVFFYKVKKYFSNICLHILGEGRVKISDVALSVIRSLTIDRGGICLKFSQCSYLLFVLMDGHVGSFFL